MDPMPNLHFTKSPSYEPAVPIAFETGVTSLAIGVREQISIGLLARNLETGRRRCEIGS